MKTLNTAAMENVQGGVSGSISIGLPLTGLLSTLGLSGLLGLGLGLGLNISYDIEGLNLPSLPSL